MIIFETFYSNFTQTKHIFNICRARFHIKETQFWYTSQFKYNIEAVKYKLKQ